MKTIGVLGGLGPQATMDFEARVHRVSQQLILPRENAGYPPMIVYYCRFPPVILDEERRPVQPLQVNPPLLEAARELGSLADFLVIIANAPHVFQREVQEASGRHVLSMIEVTLAELERREWEKVGLLGLGEPRIYIEPLQEKGLEYVTLTGEPSERLDRAIFSVMEGADGEQEQSIAENALQRMRAGGVDGIILGCTEIPLLIPGESEAEDTLNPAQLLAEAAVQYAMADSGA